MSDAGEWSDHFKTFSQISRKICSCFARCLRALVSRILLHALLKLKVVLTNHQTPFITALTCLAAALIVRDPLCSREIANCSRKMIKPVMVPSLFTTSKDIGIDMDHSNGVSLETTIFEFEDDDQIVDQLVDSSLEPALVDHIIDLFTGYHPLESMVR